MDEGIRPCILVFGALGDKSFVSLPWESVSEASWNRDQGRKLFTKALNHVLMSSHWYQKPGFGRRLLGRALGEGDSQILTGASCD